MVRVELVQYLCQTHGLSAETAKITANVIEHSKQLDPSLLRKPIKYAKAVDGLGPEKVIKSCVRAGGVDIQGSSPKFDTNP